MLRSCLLTRNHAWGSKERDKTMFGVLDMFQKISRVQNIYKKKM